MSRTDHHRPWKIRANDRVGVKHDDPAYFSHDDWHHLREGCCGPYCEWTMPHAALSGVPRWYRRHIWYAPERTRERAGLGAMTKEYNASGGLADEDFSCYQHRHGASWNWW